MDWYNLRPKAQFGEPAKYDAVRRLNAPPRIFPALSTVVSTICAGFLVIKYFVRGNEWFADEATVTLGMIYGSCSILKKHRSAVNMIHLLAAVRQKGALAVNRHALLGHVS